MKILDLECPSCGAKLTVDENNPSIAVCEYCNSHYALEWEEEQAHFYRGINYTTPKPPESAGSSGWGASGVKGVVFAVFAVAVLAIFFGILSSINTRHTGGSLGGSLGNMPEMKISPTEFAQTEVYEEEVLQEEETLRGALSEMAAYAFGREAGQISAEELNKIKWIEMRGDFDNLWIGYSFDEPSAEGSSLEWVSVPRDMETGKQCLHLFGGLKKLNINQVINREDIAGLKLESIGGYFDSPGEVADIVEDAGWIKEIRFNGGAESLEGLEAFTGLETLYIDYCELTDLKPLVQISGLKSLALDGLPEVRDFSVLGTMKELEELSLDAENLKTLDFLKGMEKLESLSLYDGSMISLDGLENVPALHTLVVDGCGELKNMDAVSGLAGLKELSLELPYDCAEPDLTKMTQLEKLNLSQFDDCDFVGNLTGLKELTLNGCTISPEVDLSGLTNLKSLTCHAFVSTGKDLSFAKGFTALEKLDLQGMSTYDDISWAFNSSTIKELNISGMECEINFDLIGENQTLESLSMDGLVLYNNVQVDGGGGIVYVDWDDVELSDHTEFLGKLKGVKSLSIAENELTDIEFATEMPLLETIDLSDNYVTDLKPLTGLKALKSVNCSGNPITNERVLDDKVILINE